MKRWLSRIAALAAVLLVALVGVVLWSADRTERPVGFDVGRAANSLGQPFAIAIWYPTSATPWPTTPLGARLMSVARGGAVQGEQLPLIVLSHGNGGGPGSHVDLALALANAGYVVAAPMHAGDNFQDGSGLRLPTFWSNRNQEVRAAIDYVLGGWSGRSHVDQTRVGAFGYSAGGFTVLTVAGGRPDLGFVASRCANAPEFVCEVLRVAGSPLLRTSGESVERGFVADPRIRSLVVAAPGLGFTFANGGLRGVSTPVQIWIGERDRVTPDASNGAIVRDELKSRVEAHTVPGAGHASFLAPCRLLRPPGLCEDEETFDRAAFHRRMNTEVINFFNRTLR